MTEETKPTLSRETLERRIAMLEGDHAILDPLPFTRAELLETYRLALRSIEREGWVWVPKEPTKEMIVAGDDMAESCVDSGCDSGGDGESHNTYEHLQSDAPAKIYRAMIAAAPGDTK